MKYKKARRSLEFKQGKMTLPQAIAEMKKMSMYYNGRKWFHIFRKSKNILYSIYLDDLDVDKITIADALASDWEVRY